MDEAIIKIDRDFHLAVIYQQVIIFNESTTYLCCKNVILTSNTFEIFFDCDKIIIKGNIITYLKDDHVISEMYT